MTVPSYDDLAPGIPDVIDSEAAGNLASLLREQLAPSSSPRPASSSQLPGSDLFACVRLVAGGGKLEAASRELAAGGPLQALLAVARDFSPRVMRASGTEVLLDVSGLGRLIGPPDEIARQLARALDVPARVAIAPTQTAARLLAAADSPISRFPDSPISQLPIHLLQPLETLPPATGRRDRARIYETLARWGIATLGDLAALPAAELSARFGRRGVALQRLARGLDATPFVPDAETPRYVGRLELEWPIATLEPLSFVLARLLEPLSIALERADRGAAAVHLTLRLTDRSTDTRLLPLPAPIREARVLRTLLLLDLESRPPSPLRGPGETALTAAIDVVTIELDPAPGRITQFSLLQRALPSPETLSTLTARLAAIVGETRVGAAALVDSHRPDGFVMRGYAPEGEGGGADGVGAKDAKGANGATGAEDAACVPSPVLRRERRSVALSVRVERGRPVYIAPDRRGVPYGAIVQAAGPWRTSGEWWSDRAWNHSEWDVALKSGAVCRIYQDRTTERWFFAGLYD